MGSVVFGTTTIQGRKFDDIKVQKSKAGIPRPIVFGTVRPIVGNIIAAGEPIIITDTQTEGGGGLGLGPKVRIQNQRVFRTYAIRICEGPVTAVTRIWRNSELVFVNDPESYVQQFYADNPAIDVTLPELFRIMVILSQNSAAFAGKYEVFLGGFDQMPSAELQAQFGVENVHAYRGTCYMVAAGDELTSTGGAIPQWTFEVSRCPDTPMVY